MSGVDLMKEYVVQQFEADRDIRLIVMGVLIWLASSPAFRRAEAPQHARPGDAHPKPRARTV
jgi:hypothetical protein